jgi:hypothetical protein
MVITIPAWCVGAGSLGQSSSPIRKLLLAVHRV